MNPRDIVDPELLPALDAWPPGARTLADLHARRAKLPEMLLPPERYARPDIAMERRLVPGPMGAPEVPVYLYRPVAAAGPLPVYLHIHGGGYVFGNAEMCGPADVAIAAELGCLVASVDYRLAPETVAPGAVEDCYAVLRWLHEKTGELGVDPHRIAIGGESAGGGLAAALALLARDRAEFPICLQLLNSPMLDDRTVTAADVGPHVGNFVWTQAENAFGWRSLLGCEPGAPGISPYCAPGRAEDLAGLPPAHVSVGALDLFRDETVRYALRLLHAGVATDLHVYAGAYHGFERTPQARVVQAAEASRRAALRKAFLGDLP